MEAAAPFFANHKFLLCYRVIFAAGLAALPVVGILFPRALSFIPVLIALFGMTAYRPAYGFWPRFSRKVFAWVFSLIALMALSALWSLDSSVVGDRILKSLPVLIGGGLLLCLAKNTDEQTRSIFQRWFPLAVLVSGIICILELYGGAPLYHFFHPDYTSENPLNIFFLNRSVVIFILCALPALYCAPKKVRIAILAVTALVLFQSNSQSAQLGFIVAVVFYFIFPWRREKAWYGLIALLSALLFAAPWIAQILFKFLAPVAGDYTWLSEGYAASRTEIWDFVARRALEHPWLGHGIEATRVITDFDNAGLYHEGTTVLHPHNFALQIWIELGVLGITFFAGFFGFVIWHIRKSPDARFLISVLFAAIAMASTSYGFWQGWWLGLFAALFVFCILAGSHDSPVPKAS